MAKTSRPFSLRREDQNTGIMGILNATPDSFHSPSRQSSVEEAIVNGLMMIQNGSEIIDIGGESTRPGSEPVTIREEIERVIPIIEGICEQAVNPNISIDTRNVEVARKAIQAGASMINDVSGLRDDAMKNLVLDTGVPVCIMHMLGDPKTMQSNPMYSNVIEEVCSELHQKATELIDAGHPAERICLDPGIGFGKTLDHNIKLLKAHETLRGEHNLAILWGVSRKSMIGQITGHEHPKDRLYGTLGVAAYAQQQNIDWLRVHDVQAHTDLLSVMRKMN
ncbi:MAG: dihydropteroate synthase [Euryarchaeota archaeon]|nr:dihydropteroate synthase [Euryarchaeota archaeon]